MKKNGEDVRKQIGNSIRTFRRQRNMTIEELGERVNKSKSTISKYETGNVPMDVDTLAAISKALDVPLHQLTFLREEGKQKTDNKANLYEENELFLYYYDGTRRKIIKTYLRVVYDEVSEEHIVYYYLGLKSYQNYRLCDYIYKGKMYSYDLISYYFVTNLVNPVDHLTICIFNPLHKNKTTEGILLALLERPFGVYSTKVIVSKQLIADEDLRKEDIIMTSDEYKGIRNKNMLFVGE